MLWIVILSLMLITCTSIVHYRQHFKFQLLKISKVDARSRSTSVALTTKEIIKKQKLQEKKCCFTITSTDDQEYDFFPSSFWCYSIFMAFLCILLIIKCSLGSINKNNLLLSSISDYTITYGIMLLSVWESSFSFYRYFTTRIATTTCQLVTTKYILKKFILYAFGYALLFSVCIHVMHTVFPGIVALYWTFNMCCIYSNTKMLIERYQPLLKSIKTPDNDIVDAIYFMRKISILSNIISSIYLSIFVYSQNINATYYLCILWALSCFIFSLNFVRNRKYILYKLYRLSQCIRCKNKSPDEPIIAKTNSLKKKLSVKLDVQDDCKATPYNTVSIVSPNLVSPLSAMSVLETPSVNYKFAENNPYKNIKTRSVNQTNNSKPELQNHRSTKVFDVLGLTPSCSNRYYNDSYNFAPSLVNNEKQNGKTISANKIKSNIKLNLGLHSKSKNSEHVNIEEESDEPAEPKYVEMITPQISDNIINAYDMSNLNNYKMDTQLAEVKEPLEDCLVHFEGTQTLIASQSAGPKEETLNANNHLPSFINSTSVPVNSLLKNKFHLKVFDKLRSRSIKASDMICKDWNEYNGTAGKNTTLDEINTHNIDEINRNKHVLSDDELNIENAMLSLNILAKHGFCSRNSINSAHQLKLHQIKLSHQFDDMIKEINCLKEGQDDEHTKKLELTTVSL